MPTPETSGLPNGDFQIVPVPMSRRDWLAAASLAGYRASRYTGEDADKIAKWAVVDADALLVELDRTSPSTP